MTRDDIIRMAREAGIRMHKSDACYYHTVSNDLIERFAHLVAKHEREECARYIYERWPGAQDIADELMEREAA